MAHTSVRRSQIHHSPLTAYYLRLTAYCLLLTSVRRSQILTRESKPLETT